LEIIKKYAKVEIFKNDNTVAKLHDEIQKVDDNLAKKLEETIAEFHPNLLLNMYVDSDDEANALSVKVASKDLLSLEIEYLGYIHRDDTVLKSIKSMVPFISYDPKCEASRDLADIIIKKILHSGKFDSFRRKHTIRQKKQTWDNGRHGIICTVKCIYWEECEYKNGGYPCKLQHLMHIKGFHNV
jgi:MinD-like ATPase involved in chromosome partitioning or flagellar assembly